MRDARLRRIDELITLKRFAAARRVIGAALKRSPGDHRLLTRKARLLSDEDRLREALVWHRKALEITPTCPVALWDYAQTVGGKEAAKIHRNLNRRGARGLSSSCCIRSIGTAQSMITDSYWVLALWSRESNDLRGALTAAENCVRRIRSGHPGGFVRMRSARTVLHILQKDWRVARPGHHRDKEGE